MKRILLFITATLLLASGTSCSDDNTNFDPIGDELGIPYKDGHDVYGVEVWEETSVILTNYYSLIEEIIQEKTAKIQSIWWLSPAKEKCNVRWNCSAPIMGKTDHSSSYIINPDYNMNSSQITIDLTDVTDNFTVEAIVSIGNLSIRRFQTIPIVTNEIRCDAFYYTFGTPLMQLEIIELCLQDTNGLENFVKNFAKSYYTWDNSKEAIEARTQAISGYLTKELQDLNVDTIRTDIPTSSTVTDVIVWHIEQSGADTFSATYEVDQQIKEGEQTSNVKATYTVKVHVDADGDNVKVKVAVKFLDNQTKATQISWKKIIWKSPGMIMPNRMEIYS